MVEGGGGGGGIGGVRNLCIAGLFFLKILYANLTKNSTFKVKAECA